MKLKHQLFFNAAITMLLIYFFEVNRWLLNVIPILSFLILVYLFRKYWKQIKNSKFCFNLLRGLVLLLQPFFKKDTYILFDNLYEVNAECVDTYCVFRYMQEHNIKSYYVVWKNNPFYEKLKSDGIKNIIVVKNSVHNHTDFEFFRKIWPFLLKTKAVITSFGDLNKKTTRFFYKNKYITYHHIGHGSTFLKTFILASSYLSHLKYNKFLVCSEREADIFQQYGWKKENLPVIGLPRCDNLHRELQQYKTIFIMFTWRTSFGRWNKSKFTTPLEQTVYSTNIKSFLTDERLQKILKKNNIKIQVALHHALVNQTDGRYKFDCENVEVVPCENISQYIGKADLFITDYSSIFFDFAFLDTPIVFYRPDFDDDTLLKFDRDDMANAKSKDDMLYNVCYDVETAVNCVEKYIKNGFILEEENKQKNNALFSTKENITEKFVSYLEKL